MYISGSVDFQLGLSKISPPLRRLPPARGLKSSHIPEGQSWTIGTHPTSNRKQSPMPLSSCSIGRQQDSVPPGHQAFPLGLLGSGNPFLDSRAFAAAAVKQGVEATHYIRFRGAPFGMTPHAAPDSTFQSVRIGVMETAQEVPRLAGLDTAKTATTDKSALGYTIRASPLGLMADTKD